MKTLSNIRKDARTALKGNWLTTVLFLFVYGLVGSLITTPFQCVGYFDPDNDALFWLLYLIALVLCAPMTFGIYNAFLCQQRGGEMRLGQLFSGYTKRVWLTELLKQVYALLWTLLLIIPGCVKIYSYAMTEYIMADDKEIGYNAAIEKSMEMMQGNKWRLFLLDLSFIGWYILGFLCFFIGLFWSSSYANQAHAAFYEDLKNRQ